MNLGTASEYLDDLSVRGLIPSARAAWLHLHGPPRRPQPRALIWVRRVSRRGRGHSARPSSVATRAQYIYTTSGKIHIEMSRHQVLKTLHSSLSVRCDELHLVLLRSCDYISSCAQRLNAGRNQGHVKVVSGARNASFVHTVTVLTLCVSRTPRNSTSPQCSLRLAASRRHTSPRTARAERSAGVSLVSGSPPRAGSQTP
jgi:hypothetical protein